MENITNLKLPSTLEEWYATFNFTDDKGNSIYMEVPAIFVDDVLDESATMIKIQDQINSHNKRINLHDL